jgi:hypothetical protein
VERQKQERRTESKKYRKIQYPLDKKKFLKYDDDYIKESNR